MQPKILLVDDREDNLLSIEAILAPDGYQFFRAYSGQQALKILLNEFDFAMILMDVKMPILNGFETATLIYEREKLRQIPIIFITANNYGDENIFKGYKAGGIDYIFKPINPEVLRAKVSVFIELYKKNVLLSEQEHLLSVSNKNLEKEITELKATEEKAKQLNAKLQKEISNLESILASSTLSIDRSEFEQTDLNPLIKNFLADMEHYLRKKMATVLIEPLPTLKVNRVLMRPLFQHLIRNALYYSKESVKPVVKIRSENGMLAKDPDSKNLGDNKKYHQIIVEDNGVGFGHKNVDNIFSTNGELKKINNGLAICKKIMEKHDGFIFARGKIDEGSTFIISFPQ